MVIMQECDKKKYFSKCSILGGKYNQNLSGVLEGGGTLIKMFLNSTVNILSCDCLSKSTLVRSCEVE